MTDDLMPDPIPPSRKWWVIPLITAFILFLAGVGVGVFWNDRPSTPPQESMATGESAVATAAEPSSEVAPPSGPPETAPPAGGATPPHEESQWTPLPQEKKEPAPGMPTRAPEATPERAPPKAGPAPEGDPKWTPTSETILPKSPVIPLPPAESEEDDESQVQYEELMPHEPPPPIPPRPPGAHAPGRVAIIIDDMGYTPTSLAIARLPYAITLAILPGGDLSRQTAAIGKSTSKEIILHQPMEPKGYPRVKPGPGALFSNMEPDQIRQILVQNLQQFPEAVGVNNHMGSRLTENRELMNAVMDTLLERPLFFVDSRTSQASVAYARALAKGVRATRRDVFLDNIQKGPSIDARLAELEHIAHQTGRAVGIGHPYRETLNALQRWLPEATKRGVSVEAVSHFLRSEPAAGDNQEHRGQLPRKSTESVKQERPKVKIKPTPPAPQTTQRPETPKPVEAVKPVALPPLEPPPQETKPLLLDSSEHVLPVDQKP